MAINFFCEEVDFTLPNKALHRNWLKQVVISEGKVIGNINFIFCSDVYLLNVNQKYLSHDYFTDIITFDYCENNKMIGDIFISIDTVQKNSVEFKNTFPEELDRVLVHGILHLIGYKDDSENNKIEMRNKEDFYLYVLHSNFIIN